MNMNKCPRCGNNFNCGASDITTCFCTTVSLSNELILQLKYTYNNCLCSACLQYFTQKPTLAVPNDK